MPGAIKQTHPVRRPFMDRGDARVVEALRNSRAFGQPRVPLDQGTTDQTMRDHHQRTVHASATVHDEGKCIRDMKARPVFPIGRREVGSERIFSQVGI
jgi:hypothetical protein